MMCKIKEKERTRPFSKKVHFFTYLLMCFLFIGGTAFAQNKITVKGVVTDSNGEPLIGATVGEKGTTNAMMTGIDGDYTLSVSSAGTLTVTYIGFHSQEVAVNGKTTINVTLVEDSKILDEVVVTALGIKREAKSLGYAMQELKGDALLETRENNVLNALSGKVAGLQVLRSSNGVGGSSKIVLRGNNSLTGNNQPLIVIDGIPMDNFTGGVNDPFGNNGMDMGSGLGDINQEDIESMSVLKGASAAALYGSRAGNGVILITTKSGKQRPGIGVTLTAGLSIENPFLKPKMQNKYGQGATGIYDPKSRFSWGPKIAGYGDVTNWEDKTEELRAYDNFDAFFRTGVSFNEGATFQQDINGTSVFASINRSDDNGTTPRAKLNKTSFTARATSFLDNEKKWQIDAKANYINMHAQNRPIMGINPANAYNTIYLMPTTLNLKDLKREVDENGNMLWYEDGNTPQENPYWVTTHRLNEDKRDRLLGSMKLKYKPTDWLSVELSGGTDYYTTRANAKTRAGSPNALGGGRYTENKETFYENNYSFLAVANKDNLIDKLSGSISFGGNLMYRGRDTMRGDSGQLETEEVWNLNNGINAPTISSRLERRRMNSLYGVINLNWDNYLYLDVTGRNDWSSTLHPDNNSYFYPSVNLSLIASDLLSRHGITMPSWFTFAKIRGSYAEVGNDLDPYQLYNTYEMGKNALTYNVVNPLREYYDHTVKSELIKSWEAGLDLRFLDGRIGLDATWYKSNATNQLLSIQTNPLSGYERKKVNAGNIENQGFEIALNGTILDNPQGLSWNVIANFSKNKDKIIELYDDVKTYSLGEYQDVRILATKGGEYGAMYGRKYRRVEDKANPHYGKIIVDDSGLPLFTDDYEYLGNQNPNCMLGITNNFSYKGLNLSFLVDMRFGGKFFSGTTALLHRFGKAAGTVVNGERNDFVVPNTVVADGNGGYAANAVAVSNERYWTRIYDSGENFGIAEPFTYDATNIRLRNITLGYDFNKKLLAKTPFQRVRVSATCNNVWMIHYKLPGIDPESVSATDTNAIGFEGNAAPTSRTFVFNLTLGF
ncbi:MAG: SusC/RagA family TonB-linked outer membrane protein [Dysgonomonas sp.]|nr:SusC/RagA family TonB-linked outer membrane protein [Dysgonomonas sp.]